MALRKIYGARIIGYYFLLIEGLQMFLENEKIRSSFTCSKAPNQKSDRPVTKSYRFSRFR
jgi:hypothetical protein